MPEQTLHLPEKSHRGLSALVRGSQIGQDASMVEFRFFGLQVDFFFLLNPHMVEREREKVSSGVSSSSLFLKKHFIYLFWLC